MEVLFQVDSNGNVGIGTTSPDSNYKLDLTTETLRSGAVILNDSNQKIGTTSNTLALFG